MIDDSQLPPPFTTSDCDLTGMDWMPLHGHRLLKSDFYLRATDREKIVALEIWWASWFQVPAASLPNDDRVIASLAGYARDPKGWAKIRKNVLHGFVKCSDGRLYHRFLSTEALISFEKRLKNDTKRATDRVRLQAWRDAKAKKEEAEKTGKTVAVSEIDTCDETIPETSSETTDETRFVGGRPYVTLQDKTIKKGKSSLRSPCEAEGFEQFWQVYPRKVRKAAARKAWTGAMAKTSSTAVMRALSSQQFGSRERFIPHPATWLNGEQWLDEAEQGDPVLRAAGLFDAGTPEQIPEFLRFGQ